MLLKNSLRIIKFSSVGSPIPCLIIIIIPRRNYCLINHIAIVLLLIITIRRTLNIIIFFLLFSVCLCSIVFFSLYLSPPLSFHRGRILSLSFEKKIDRSPYPAVFDVASSTNINMFIAGCFFFFFVIRYVIFFCFLNYIVQPHLLFSRKSKKLYPPKTLILTTRLMRLYNLA